MAYCLRILLVVTCVVVIALTSYIAFEVRERPKVDTPLITTNNRPTIIDNTTTVTTIPKDNPTAPDVVIDQHYTAKVNGETITVPVETVGTDGTTGVINQEIDLTPVVDKAIDLGYEAGKKNFKKNWEISTGLGVHEGNYYIPVEVQRNYVTDKAVSAEVHFDYSSSEITGCEIKHTWKF